MSSYLISLNTLFWGLSVVFLLSSFFMLLLLEKGVSSVQSGMLQPFFDLGFIYSLENMIFALIVSGIALSVFYWAGFYMSSGFKLTFFFAVLFSFVASMLLLLLSNSVLALFLGWEGLGVTSFALIMFYQNWLSAKGSLLTLLTNRLGDGLLVTVLCFWASSSLESLTLSVASSVILLVLMVAFTKSAQWPFMNWLPAAMAAPTPVSALVHSSTLVTAGIWLLMRFKQLSWLTSTAWASFGLLTLVLASLSAFMETDAKKVVALSTLSQLGLMVLSLSLGGLFMCLFHTLTHALAKANLFLVIGNLLHTGFSQQDARKLSTKGLSYSVRMALLISVFSLSGLLFMSGFFSKEQVMVMMYITATSKFSILALASLSCLTLGYCLKLMLSVLASNLMQMETSLNYEKSQSPILSLSSSSVVFGYLFSSAVNPAPIFVKSTVGLYWSFLGLSGALLVVMLLVGVLSGFSLNDKIILILTSFSLTLKRLAGSLENSLSEPLYLVTTQTMTKAIELSGRSIYLVTGTISILLMM